MRRIIAAVLLASIALSPLAGAGEKHQFGLSFPTLQMIFFNTLNDAVKAKADELGVEVASLEANNEVARQISIVEDMITKAYEGILLVPIETEGVVPAVEKLNAANIPVVTVDRRISTEHTSARVLCHAGADNVLGGENAAKFIVDKLTKKYGSPKGTVIELYGMVGAGPAIDRSAGFQKVMKQYPEITLKTQTAHFTRSDGMKVMEDFIISTPQIDAVFGANDEMVMGAIQAMDGSGKFDFNELITVGFDCIDDAKESIKEGVLTASIEQFPGRQASEAFEVLYDYVVKGIQPKSDLILIEPQVITKDNIESAYK